MELPRTLQKMTKWLWLLTLIGVTTVWIGSYWWALTCLTSRGTYIAICSGQFSGDDFQSGPRGPRGWHLIPNNKTFFWGFGISASGNNLDVEFALWPLVLGAAVPTAIAWRRGIAEWRRVPRGLCRNCRYDRSGLSDDDACPECGTSGWQPTPWR